MNEKADLENLTKRVRELEAALKEAEEKYRLIAENTAEISAILDMNLRFTHVSPAIQKIRGFTPEEIMAQPLEQGLTPESLSIAIQVFAEELELEALGTADPDRVRILELEEYRKDGSTIWLEVSLSFLRDRQGKAIGILALSRDITKRRQAESDLWMFRETVDNASNVIGIARPDGTHIYQKPFTIENLGAKVRVALGE